MWWLKRIISKIKKEKDEMKYLIVGLGNIGNEYINTRHNIGFNIVEYIAEEKEITFSTARYGDIARFKHRGRQIIMLKPSTFMNLSGKAVRYWLEKENVLKKNLLVVVDDLNLPFTTVRMRGKGSDGGHNGLKSIDQLIAGNNYPRLRIGIGDTFNRGKQIDFVLGRWSDEEKPELINIYKLASKFILSFVSIGLERTMNSLNSKSSKK